MLGYDILTLTPITAHRGRQSKLILYIFESFDVILQRAVAARVELLFSHNGRVAVI